MINDHDDFGPSDVSFKLYNNAMTSSRAEFLISRNLSFCDNLLQINIQEKPRI